MAGTAIGPAAGPCVTPLSTAGVPGLNKPSDAVVLTGGAPASKRKLYAVPDRRELAVGLAANGSVDQVIESPSRVQVQGE